MGATKRQFSSPSEFGRWIVSELQRAGCTDKQVAAIAGATVDATINSLRENRSEALATNPTAHRLAKQQSDFEDALVHSVARALPKPKRRGRKRDPDAIEKCIRILALDPRYREWKEIGRIIEKQFGAASLDAYKKVYKRRLPAVLSHLWKKVVLGLPDDFVLHLARRWRAGPS